MLVFGVQHQGICGIFPFGDAPEHQPLREIGRQVLQGMNSDIGTPDKHLGLELFCEQPLVTNFGQGYVENFVALGGHRFHGDGQSRMSLFQFGFHPVGLHHRQLASAGGDAQFGEGHWLGRSAVKTTNSRPAES